MFAGMTGGKGRKGRIVNIWEGFSAPGLFQVIVGKGDGLAIVSTGLVGTVNHDPNF